MVFWRVTCAGWTVCETEDEDEALRIYSQQGPYGDIQEVLLDFPGEVPSKDLVEIWIDDFKRGVEKSWWFEDFTDAELWVDDDVTLYMNPSVEELFEIARQEIIANPDVYVGIRFILEVDHGFGHTDRYDAGYMDLYARGIPCPNA